MKTISLLILTLLIASLGALNTKSFYCQDKIIITYQYYAGANFIAFKIFDNQNKPLKQDAVLVGQNVYSSINPQIFMDADNKLNFVWYSKGYFKYNVNWQKYDLNGKPVWKNPKTLAKVVNPHDFTFQALPDGSYLTFSHLKEVSPYKTKKYVHHTTKRYLKFQNPMSSTIYPEDARTDVWQKYNTSTNNNAYLVKYYDKSHKKIWMTRISNNENYSHLANIKAFKLNDQIYIFHIDNSNDLNLLKFTEAGKMVDNYAIESDQNTNFEVITMGNNFVLNFEDRSIRNNKRVIALLDSTFCVINSVNLRSKYVDEQEPYRYDFFDVHITPLDTKHLSLTYKINYTKTDDKSIFQTVLSDNLIFDETKALKYDARFDYQTHSLESFSRYTPNQSTSFFDKTGNLIYSIPSSLHPDDIMYYEFVPTKTDEYLMVSLSSYDDILVYNFIRNGKTILPNNVIVSNITEKYY